MFLSSITQLARIIVVPWYVFLYIPRCHAVRLWWKVTWLRSVHDGFPSTWCTHPGPRIFLAKRHIAAAPTDWSQD